MLNIVLLLILMAYHQDSNDKYRIYIINLKGSLKKIAILNVSKN